MCGTCSNQSGWVSTSNSWLTRPYARYNSIALCQIDSNTRKVNSLIIHFRRSYIYSIQRKYINENIFFNLLNIYCAQRSSCFQELTEKIFEYLTEKIFSLGRFFYLKVILFDIFDQRY